MHKADARARLVKIDRRTGNPSAIFDMTPVFEGHLEAAQRTFIRQKTGMLQVRDQFTFSATTQNLTWQMMTRAEVQVEPGRIILKKDGKELFLVVSCTAPWEVKVVSLSPPPLSYDLNIPGLKRIEIRINRKAFPGDSGEISVKLTNQSGTML